MWYKIKCAVARFMYGRNGADQLGQAMIWLYLAMWPLQMLFAALKLNVIVAVLEILTYVIMAVVIFRLFSKNLPKRRAENQKWLNWWWKKKNSIAGAKARHADKDHKYFTCRQCGTICRVPAGKGKIVITCPKCSAQIQGKS